MPGARRHGAAPQGRAEQPELEVIVLTAHGTVETAVEAMKLGAFDYLQKPIDEPRRAAAAGRARARAPRRCATAASERDRDDAATRRRSPTAIRRWRRSVEALRKVARTDATVLLLGESGTGKEVAARAIHAWSARAPRARSWPSTARRSPRRCSRASCSATRRARSPGATTRRRGRIELADGGTFFLDEVGELKPELQAKLLRVLQERQLRARRRRADRRGRRALDRRDQPRPRAR